MLWAHYNAIDLTLTERFEAGALYDILDLPYLATCEELKEQYNKMSLKHHPDKNLGDADAQRKVSTYYWFYPIKVSTKVRLQ
jgi:DnaJ-class molecular chaperone